MLNAIRKLFLPTSSDTQHKAGLPVKNPSQSFWHSEPSKLLLGHRSTKELPNEADVVIVGTGITGTSVARFLSESEQGKHLEVVLIDAREACWGATGRNGGHCQPLLFDRSVDVALFELKNYDAVRSYISENDIPCEWRSTVGCRTFWTPELLSAAELEVEQLKKAHSGIGKRVEVIKTPERLQEHNVAQTAAGATLTHDAASLWPYKLVTWTLERLVEGKKINLQTNTPVTKLTAVDQSDTGKGRWTVHTDRGTVRAKHVVLATNGYTSHLLPEFSDLIVPVRGEMSALLPPEGSKLLPDTYGFVGAKGANPNADDYLVQRPFEGVKNPKGHLMFGGGRAFAQLESVGQWDDSPVDEGAASYLRKTLLELLELSGETSGLEELTASHQWTGIMGYSRDNHPFVGQLSDKEGIWLSAGYTGHGMPNGTLCGKAIADMLLAVEAGEDLSTVQQRMVEQGDLPKSYLITDTRLARAMKLDSVAVQDGVEI